MFSQFLPVGSDRSVAGTLDDISRIRFMWIGITGHTPAPMVSSILVQSLDKNQQLGIDLQDFIPGPLAERVEVCSRVSRSPGHCT